MSLSSLCHVLRIAAIAFFLSCGTLPIAVANTPFPQKNVAETAALIQAADAVVAQIRTDNVQAAKEVDAVFLAANRLAQEDALKQARYYFEAGLQLSPWNMLQQLAYADVLHSLGEQQRASSVAKLVAETTETANLLQEARKLAGIHHNKRVLQLPAGTFERPVIALVKVGEVEDWIVEDAGIRLMGTLGTPVFLSDTVVPLPRHHRSFYQRWGEQLKENVVWEHPFVQQQMRDLSVESRESATLDETLELLARITVAQGHDDPRPSFPTLKRKAQAQDQQWDASQLWGYVHQLLPKRENVTVIGITQVDIYTGDNNFVFGLADLGTGYAVVSTKRFEAQFNGERENQQRFLDRLHKQLLSSVGFAFGIPRPTDPRSARSYPNGLADHDLKGTWLAREDLEAFEKFLGHKLPEATWNDSREHW